MSRRDVIRTPYGRHRPPVKDGRGVALRVLSEAHQVRAFGADLLDRTLATGDLDAREAALARELVLGVVRHRLTLDRLIDRHLHGKPSNLDPRLREILRLGLYQCLWLERIPDHAAVNEAVDQAKRLVGRRAAGLVNGLLRTILGQVVRIGPPGDGLPAAHQFCVDAQRVCDLDHAWLPDPTSDPAGYWSAATSHPRALVGRWLKRYGPARTEQICLYGACRPHQWLRPNRLRISAAELARRLRLEGAGAEPLEDTAVLYIDGPPPVTTAAFAEGLFQPQDITGIEVVQVLDPQPGELILDLCAAPGTKTAAIAERIGNQGMVFACDRDMDRLAAGCDNFMRLGVTAVQLIAPQELSDFRSRYGAPDAILLDVPCSNTGVLARRPEARYRFTPRRLAGLTKVQSELLDRSAELAWPGTRLLYNTCSIAREENEAVVERFLERHPGWKLADAALRLPSVGRADSPPRDGGFWALMRNEASDSADRSDSPS